MIGQVAGQYKSDRDSLPEQDDNDFYVGLADQVLFNLPVS